MRVHAPELLQPEVHPLPGPDLRLPHGHHPGRQGPPAEYGSEPFHCGRAAGAAAQSGLQRSDRRQVRRPGDQRSGIRPALYQGQPRDAPGHEYDRPGRCDPAGAGHQRWAHHVGEPLRQRLRCGMAGQAAEGAPPDLAPAGVPHDRG